MNNPIQLLRNLHRSKSNLLLHNLCRSQNGTCATLEHKSHLKYSVMPPWLALLIFVGRPSIVLPFKDMPVACLRQKKGPDFSVGALCSHYLSSRAVTRQVLSAYMCLTSVFGMGTGGPTWQSIRTHYEWLWPSFISKPFQAEILVTHTGFEPMLTAWEAAVLTTWPMGHWCTFTDSNRGPTD